MAMVGVDDSSLQADSSRSRLLPNETKTTVVCGIDRELTLYGHIKTAQRRTNIQQYGDWYTGR